jgi:hypothetical protein
MYAYFSTSDPAIFWFSSQNNEIKLGFYPLRHPFPGSREALTV